VVGRTVAGRTVVGRTFTVNLDESERIRLNTRIGRATHAYVGRAGIQHVRLSNPQLGTAKMLAEQASSDCG
jgi:hypothetical protein